MRFPTDLAEDGAPIIGNSKISYRGWRWVRADDPAVGAASDARAALAAMAARRALTRLVVGVVGPRDATGAQYEAAFEIGRALGALRVTTICGGKSGVMEAVAAGVADADGLSIGLLPGHSPEDANPYVSVPLATGLSEGRNMVIAKAARVLVAVGGSYGTLTEVAYGLHFSKPVIGLEGAPEVEGLRPAADPEDAVERVARALFETAAPLDADAVAER